ncbi:MAG: hypothetical protein GF331_12210 [Chitinivibrionales bacterium]|nr:hypothetical protein [Chitinivibrionales bacterium]
MKHLSCHTRCREVSNGVLRALGIVALAAAAAGVHALDQSLETYVDRALRVNPAIVSARSRLRAAHSGVGASLAIPDPTVSAGYFISEVETRAGPQQGKFGISQPIPWPGTLVGRREVAAEQVDIASEELQQVRVQVVADLRASYAALYSAGRTLRALRENLALLEQVESVLLSRYQTGAAGQGALLRVQVESARLEDRIGTVESNAEVYRARIGALLDMHADSVVAFPDSLPLLDVPDSLTLLTDMVLRHGPVVGQAREQYEKARETVDLVRSESFSPRLMLMTDYIVTGETESPMVAENVRGKDAWVVGLGVTLPLWLGPKRGRVAAAREQRGAALANIDAAANRSAAEAVAVYEEYADAVRRIELLRSVLTPKAEQAMRLTEEAYRNAEAGIVDLLDTQRTLLGLQIDLAKQRARQEAAAARLDALTGGELSGVGREGGAGP